jgi:hypothetical protein
VTGIKLADYYSSEVNYICVERLRNGSVRIFLLQRSQVSWYYSFLLFMKFFLVFQPSDFPNMGLTKALCDLNYSLCQHVASLSTFYFSYLESYSRPDEVKL